MAELDGKQIVLGVSGGIAAYKAPDLVRRLRERGAEVQVVLTRGATHFVTPLTFQAVSGRPVRDDLWDEAGEAAMGHIELARWADLVLVSPATADLMARLACGMADDLLTTLCLATEAPLVLAPAMNRVMWAQPATRSNAETLVARGATLLGPGEGDQACGEIGAGRMLEPSELADEVVAALGAASGSLSGRRVVVTAGPTREAIDPVRYVTNRSSGKMGFAVAAAARAAGADVTLIAGPVAQPTPTGVQRIDVESAAQMMEATRSAIRDADIFIAAAAVADYRPARAEDQKIKKTDAHMDLELERNPDILSTVAGSDERPFVVGFAAETQDVEANAFAKLEAKGLDMIAANLVGPNAGFDSDHNELAVLWPGGGRCLPKANKRRLAEQLIALVGERMDEGSRD
ncbi:MAG: bifunctional phosphopantothenoylcysteine decarboxylase/phosphopantothenate--cysteine ligase CoaBC [Chromatiales bacterium]|jgi:phosphopantothenoylcysteine decarboxylase/phosphopantothenate--cysteine ligase|nr:bifunctional phosphopantothenoylcysteine decarboxylase/phosphopantothenate--cysteine ligase CoaBC [Chromatiales bacterium]